MRMADIIMGVLLLPLAGALVASLLYVAWFVLWYIFN